jgi:hypothetical protein
MSSIKVIPGCLDVSTRGKRRKATALIIEMLEKIKVAEEGYMSRIPPNLLSGEACSEANDSIDAIIEA